MEDPDLDRFGRTHQRGAGERGKKATAWMRRTAALRHPFDLSVAVWTYRSCRATGAARARMPIPRFTQCNPYSADGATVGDVGTWSMPVGKRGCGEYSRAAGRRWRDVGSGAGSDLATLSFPPCEATHHQERLKPLRNITTPPPAIAFDNLQHTTLSMLANVDSLLQRATVPLPRRSSLLASSWRPWTASAH